MKPVESSTGALYAPITSRLRISPFVYMLCQQCQVREATVHFSALAWPSGEDTKYLCETCYPELEAKRNASYTPEPKPLPVIDVEHLSASDYLRFAAKCHANSADAPAYRHVSKELRQFPLRGSVSQRKCLRWLWNSLNRQAIAGAWLGKEVGSETRCREVRLRRTANYWRRSSFAQRR